MSEAVVTKPRVELPVLCKWLRCKSAFGAVIPSESANDDTEWQIGNSSTEAYWCLATMEPFGPDDEHAHATVCRDSCGRGCYRR